MKIHLLTAILFLTIFQPAFSQEKPTYAIAIHGGAGRAPKDPERRQQREKALECVLTKGRTMLEQGGSSLDVVAACVRELEDSEFFNAGKGAVLNAEGTAELGASIMDGRDRAGGAVGGVQTVKNPVLLARLVMTETPHVLLVTAGAESFADEHQQIERVPNDYFITEYQRERLQKVKQKRKDMEPVDSRGTVGCVALDVHGNLAAATSTGGLRNKRFGRIGDTPILTAGTYADNATCAVSCTGTGEDFIRNAVAYDVSARMRYQNATLELATKSIVENADRKVRGGLIAVDKNGNIAMPFNSADMARAAADSIGLWIVE